MIKNWETFLESEDPNIGLVRDILTELEDEFNINMKLRSSEKDHIYFSLTINPYLDNRKSITLLNCVDDLCRRIQDMTGYECIYILSFKGKLKENGSTDWVDIVRTHSNKVNLLKYKFSYGLIKLSILSTNWHS